MSALAAIVCGVVVFAALFGYGIWCEVQDRKAERDAREKRAMRRKRENFEQRQKEARK